MALEQGARAALKRKKEQGQEGLLRAVNDRHCLSAQDLDSSQGPACLGRALISSESLGRVCAVATGDTK